MVNHNNDCGKMGGLQGRLGNHDSFLLKLLEILRLLERLFQRRNGDYIIFRRGYINNVISNCTKQKSYLVLYTAEG